jgi:hypothetical protein
LGLTLRMQWFWDVGRPKDICVNLYRVILGVWICK